VDLYYQPFSTRICTLSLTHISPLRASISQSEATCTSNWNATVDQLNGALSGALAATIPHEINDYLVPQVQAKNIPTTAFKYLNFQIGSNDVCNSCAKADGSSGPGSADDFETNIRTALEAIRTKIRELTCVPDGHHFRLRPSVPPHFFCPSEPRPFTETTSKWCPLITMLTCF
jgi:hypothetical protein